MLLLIYLHRFQDSSAISHDESLGFQTISSEDIDDYGIIRVISAIRKQVGTSPVYLT